MKYTEDPNEIMETCLSILAGAAEDAKVFQRMVKLLSPSAKEAKELLEALEKRMPIEEAGIPEESLKTMKKVRGVWALIVQVAELLEKIDPSPKSAAEYINRAKNG